MARLESIGKFNIRFHTKFKLYKSRIVSTLVYGCATCKLLVEAGKKIQAFEKKCMRMLICLSHWEHKMEQGEMSWRLSSATIKRRQISFWGQVSLHRSIYMTIMHGTVEVGRKS